MACPHKEEAHRIGPMPLEQRGTRVTGTYGYAGHEGRLAGRVRGTVLRFAYEEPSERGTGEFRLLRSGRDTEDVPWSEMLVRARD